MQAEEWPKRQTQDELNVIAFGIVNRSIFTDRDIEVGDRRMMSSVFMPLAFVNEEHIEKLAEVGMIFEHISRASSRSINGYPMFMSMQALNKADTATVCAKVVKICEAQAEALK